VNTFCVNIVSADLKKCHSFFVFAENLSKALPKAYALAQSCSVSNAYYSDSWRVESVELVQPVGV
jgi:hypothetical protein